MEHQTDYSEYSASQIICFLCNRVYQSDDSDFEPVLLFAERVHEDGSLDSSLATILGMALGEELNEATAHSDALCINCCAIVLEFENVEENHRELRQSIINMRQKAIARESESVEEQPDIVDYTDVEDFIDIAADQVDLVVGNCNVEAYNDGLNANAVMLQQDLSSLVVVPVATETVPQELLQQSYTQAEDELITVDNNEDDLFVYEVGNEEQNNTAKSINDDCLNNSINTENSDFDLETFKKFCAEQNLDEGLPVIARAEQLQSTAYVDPPQSLYKLEGDNFKCCVCRATESHSSKALVAHFQTKHKIKLYACEFCRAAFVKRQQYRTHLQQLHKNDPRASSFSCVDCPRVFTNLAHFRKHKRVHGNFECAQCKKRCSTNNALQEHMTIHSGNRPFACIRCDKDFSSKYTWSAHMKIHTERKRDFKCDKCDKGFYTESTLMQHKQTHAPDKKFICAVCSKAFGTQHNLNAHQKVHSRERPFTCGYCDKAFTRRSEVVDHERIHRGERPFECNFCHATFSQYSNLATHKKTLHLQQSLFKCEQCERTFKRRRLLDCHVQAVHTGERPIKCAQCNASFIYKEHYKKHLRTHSGIKPFACGICGKTFSSSENRKMHIFTHSNVKPYECDECKKGFRRKSELLLHLQSTKHTSQTAIRNKIILSTKTMIANGTAHINELKTIEKRVQYEILLDDMASENSFFNVIENDEDVRDIIEYVSEEDDKEEQQYVENSLIQNNNNGNEMNIIEYIAVEKDGEEQQYTITNNDCSIKYAAISAEALDED